VGQRKARVNACQQWLLDFDTVEERCEAFTASLRFFDQWYLHPDPDVDFNPLFYDAAPLPTPDMHWLLMRQWISYRKNVAVLPRGAGKSVVNEKDMMFRLLTRPGYSFIYATSSHPNARERGERIKRQLQWNDRIHDDWRTEFRGNRINPSKGHGSWSTEYMVLNNGSWIRLLSAESKQRGGRPRRYRLDDPEYDPKASTNMQTIREYMQELVFKIVIPMVTRPDTGVDWIGTFVSKRHYLWHAMKTEETPEGVRAVDSRFNNWSRLYLSAEVEMDDREIESCWPEMWPLTKAKRLAMVPELPYLKEADSLEEIREAIGPRNYNSEYLGRPGDSADAYFAALTKEKHGWWYEDVDMVTETKPYLSNTLMCWYEGEDVRRVPLKEWLTQHVRLFGAGDTSHTSTRDSDYKCFGLMAVTNNNDLFMIDLWADQTTEDKLVEATFEISDRYKCPSVHPEAIRQGTSYFNALESIVKTRATDMAQVKHLPAIKKLNPGMVDKTGKIAGLHFRFQHGKVKLPLWKRNQHPWRLLFNQIEEFNPDAPEGGLEKDDCIDVLSMSQFILRGRLNKVVGVEKEEMSVKERLLKGQFIDKNGTHVGHGLDLSQLSYSEIEAILDARVHGTDDKQPAGPYGASRI
jgi:hypothetical protein